MDNTGAITTNRIATSFAPIVSHNTHTLILGSMPGLASLNAQQYYAHPRNAFWPIICSLLNIAAASDYLQRLTALQNSGLGLWDVLAQCERPGSLDSNINSASIVPNNFRQLFSKHSPIQRLFFNGATAEQLFKRHVLPQLSDFSYLQLERLPSTSPAHASLSLEKKRDIWISALQKQG